MNAFALVAIYAALFTWSYFDMPKESRLKFVLINGLIVLLIGVYFLFKYMYLTVFSD